MNSLLDQIIAAQTSDNADRLAATVDTAVKPETAVVARVYQTVSA